MELLNYHSIMNYLELQQQITSRLDFFLTAKCLKHNVRKAEIRSSISTDHRAVFLSVEIDDASKRGPGTWKFNNKLLEDENYITLIKGSLPRILEKYHEVECYQLLWELIKMEFRSETINYSKTKRKGINKRETVLQGKLDELDNRICQGNGDLNQPLLDEYDATKKELKEIYDNKAREAMFRSKARWIEKGEKPTNYFFNLEKRNFEKKGYRTAENREWRDYYGHERNKQRVRIFL